jgi:dihydrofolate reductase
MAGNGAAAGSARPKQQKEVAMRKLVVTEFVSLDGVIENPGWSLQFMGEEQQKYKFDELSASDALLLGRTTYEELAAQWPHLSEQYGEYVYGRRT